MNKDELMKILAIPPEDLGKGTKIKVSLLGSPEEGFSDFARVFLNEIIENNSKNKHTVAILPVGPTEPYPIMVRLINSENINCNNVIIINMDEYISEDGKDYIPISNKLSFRRFMNENFYSKINPDLNVREENRIFPDPKNTGFINKRIKELGGVDICIGGLGFTGHIAFNDPPESDENISLEEYKNMSTRVINLTRETIVQNSLPFGGNVDIIPKKAITLGMKEILSSKKIYMYFTRDWQCAILRKTLHGEISAKVPGSLLQTHPNVHVFISKNACMVPLPK